MSDTLTILHAPCVRLTKLIRANGTIIGYDDAKTFDLAEVPIHDLNHLQRILAKLLSRQHCCVVRGAIADPNRTKAVRRLFHACTITGDLPTIRDVDRRWIGLDVEGVVRPDDVPAADLAACARSAIALLPGEFHPARCIAEATSSHGLKPGSRLRLWYWADRPLSGAELTHWLRRTPVDGCLFRPAQITYTAAPIFETGQDHLPNRITIVDGEALVLAPSPEQLRPPTIIAPAHSVHCPISNTKAERMIAIALMNVENALDGERHHRLRAAAVTLGGFVGEGGISEHDAEQGLLDAVLAAGGAAVDKQNAASTIAWGLANGRARPWSLVGQT